VRCARGIGPDSDLACTLARSARAGATGFSVAGEYRGPYPPLTEVSRGDEAVSTVVARTAQYQDFAICHLTRGLGQRPAGGFHQGCLLNTKRGSVAVENCDLG
ncbi:uncharacterized protein METZ01_LOCUS236400, partial [marine metagenome]